MRIRNGTPAQRHESIQRRRATKVSVSEPARTPVFVDVAAVLPSHRLGRVDRAHLLEQLDPLVAEALRARVDRRIHREQRHHLQQVVLHHVAQRADLLVELAAAFDAERLGHRDLHRVDVVVVPHRLEQRVREAEHEQVLDRLLPEEVVDAVDRALVERAVQDRVELLGRLEVATERLLDDDAAVLVDALLGEALRRRRRRGSAGWRGSTAGTAPASSASFSFTKVDSSR